MSPDATYPCPWCPFDSDDGRALRTHLMVEHRKSVLATFVCERVETGDEDKLRQELLAR